MTKQEIYTSILPFTKYKDLKCLNQCPHITILLVHIKEMRTHKEDLQFIYLSGGHQIKFFYLAPTGFRIIDYFLDTKFSGKVVWVFFRSIVCTVRYIICTCTQKVLLSLSVIEIFFTT